MAGKVSVLNENIKVLLSCLFAIENKHIKPKFMALIEKNSQLVPSAAYGFHYKGKHYTNPKIPIQTTTFTKRNSAPHLGSLHSSLHTEMDALLAEKNQLEYDEARVKAGLVILLQNAQTQQDIRDAIPNSLANLVPDLAKLPRTREEAYILKDDPQKLHQYQKVVPIIAFHAASQYLY